MNDSSSKISLIASRLPYIDRRALSEAWFSALHLAAEAPRGRHVPERRGATSARAAQAARPAAGSVASAGPAQGGARPSHSARRIATGPADLEAPRVRAHSRRGEVAVATRDANLAVRSYAPFRTSLTVGAEKERVQLLLRRDGATLHVVALCRPHVAEIVRRALSFADAHLRTRGESVRASVRPLEGAGTRL